MENLSDVRDIYFKIQNCKKTYNYALQLKYKKLRQLDYLNNSLMNEEMKFWINKTIIKDHVCLHVTKRKHS